MYVLGFIWESLYIVAISKQNVNILLGKDFFALIIGWDGWGWGAGAGFVCVCDDKTAMSFWIHTSGGKFKVC